MSSELESEHITTTKLSEKLANNRIRINNTL